MRPGRIDRLAGARLALANAVYAGIEFEPSAEDRDETYGILADEEPVALGRIQRYSDGAIEIGGFWVRESHRRRGLARRMVAHVIECLPADRAVWCLPFEHLVDFYRELGFERLQGGERVPDSILRKTEFCTKRVSAGTYRAVDLLVMRTSAPSSRQEPDAGSHSGSDAGSE